MIVRWTDAFAAPESWVAVDSEPFDPVIVTTVGWIVHDHTPGHLVIAGSRIGEDFWGGIDVIPSGMVQEIVVI